jgi:hypothetical protein
MGTALHRVRLSTGLAALLAVAMGSALMPAKVGAGCVHDGQSRGWRSDGVAHFDHLAASGAMMLPEGTMPPDRPAPGRSPNRPCSGPTCSENPSAPTPPTGVSPAEGVSHWACLNDDAVSGAGMGVDLDRTDAMTKPAELTAGVFHPPRGCQA